MGETGKNGENSKVAEPAAKTAGPGGPGAAQQEADVKIDQPSVGFDEQGYFVVKIHSRFGYLSILGFLEKAKDFMKMHVAMQENEKAQRLVKPKNGILSIFK